MLHSDFTSTKLGELSHLLLLSLIIGSSYIFYRISAPEFGPYALIEIRFVVAALTLYPAIKLNSSSGNLWPRLPLLFVLTVIGSILPFWLLAYISIDGNPGLIATILAMTPVLSSVLSYWGLSNESGGKQLLLLSLGVLCVALVSFTGSIQEESSSAMIKIIGISMLAAALLAASAHIAKRNFSSWKPSDLAFTTQITAAIVFLPVALANTPSTTPSVEAWISAILLGSIGTGVAYLLFFRISAKHGPTHACFATMLSPIFTFIIGLILVKESITIGSAVGSLVVILLAMYSLQWNDLSAPTKAYPK